MLLKGYCKTSFGFRLRSSLNRSDQRSVVTRAADHREAPLYEETDDNENAEDSYSRHRYILK